MQASAFVVEHVNGAVNWYTFLGFWVTLIGFYVTIRQVLSAKSTSEAVRDAIVEVKKAVSRDYMSDQLRDVLDDLDEVRTMHAAKVPNLASKRHASAKAKLIRLSADLELAEAERIELQATITQLSSIQSNVESSSLAGEAIEDPVRLLKNLSKQIDRLTTIQAGMKGRNK